MLKGLKKIQEQNNTKVLVMPLRNGLSYGGVLVSPNIFSRYIFFSPLNCIKIKLLQHNDSRNGEINTMFAHYIYFTLSVTSF